MEPYEIVHLNFCDDFSIKLNLRRFRNLSQSHKNTLMQALLKAYPRHSEYLPPVKNSAELGIIEYTPPVIRRSIHEFHESLRDKLKRNIMIPMKQPIKIELSCLPTSDFIFSQDPVYIPDFYKSKVEAPSLESQPALSVQYPVNVLLGNVNIIKYFNAIRYLAQPLSLSSLSHQVPVHSYITYLWGAAIDQYYQIALQNTVL